MRRLIGLPLATLAALAVGCADGALTEPPIPVARAPAEGWVSPPTAAQIAAAYPEPALAAQLEGTAAIHCAVFSSDEIGDCVISAEAPAGSGFGQAALALAPAFRVAAAAAPGEPSGDFDAQIRFAPALSAAHAPDAPASGWTVKTLPGWFVHPSNAEIAWAYPDRAQRLGIGGAVRLHCFVQTDGAATDCAIIGESPADQGFGAAALKLVPHFRMRPMTYDGKPVVAPAIIPVRFAMPR